MGSKPVHDLSMRRGGGAVASGGGGPYYDGAQFVYCVLEARV